jgi:outer membrane protein assembly factor BamE (lipoprotein component of BamABCDE complex)
MRLVVVLSIVIAFSGCASRGGLSLADLASANQSKVAQLSVGMGKEDVVALMGNATASTRDGIVNNPWTVETFTAKDGARYETLYYITRKNQPFTPVRKSLATGVVLKNGKVIGWGENALRELSKP